MAGGLSHKQIYRRVRTLLNNKARELAKDGVPSKYGDRQLFTPNARYYVSVIKASNGEVFGSLQEDTSVKTHLREWEVQNGND